ncbi:MAG: N-acetyl-gamma-glutamyl-phosphate reductase [Arenimonas sp.]
MKRFQVGLVGARGYVGSELIKLLAGHPQFELNFVASREREGRFLSEHEPVAESALRYCNPTVAEAAALGVDALVLALPNGKAWEFVAAVDATAPETVVLDLSADHRIDEGWYYGLPELTRAAAEGSRRITNPGCYATAMQLALAPLSGEHAAPPQCFGVSGYSGAGTAPSDKNDPDKLRDNLIPYSPIGHIHEREVSRQLAQPVEFMPAVAAWFRGISMTVNVHLARPFKPAAVRELYESFYRNEPLVEVIEDSPWVSAIAGRHGAQLGGFTLSPDGRRLVLVATLDNLLKGAATQALQNLNLAFGLDEMTGIPAGAAA